VHSKLHERCDAKAIESMLRRHVPQAKMLTDVGAEMTFQVYIRPHLSLSDAPYMVTCTLRISQGALLSQLPTEHANAFPTMLRYTHPFKTVY
jgi:hypothetical protein